MTHRSLPGLTIPAAAGSCLDIYNTDRRRPMSAEAPHATPRTARQAWMAVLARASSAELAALLSQQPPLPAHTRLRGPEAGLVMLQGRAGGGGAAFNLGEMTVTRCTVRLGASGPVGHAYVQGSDGRQAELAAVLDAALQDAVLYPLLFQAVILPLQAGQQARRARTARQAAATQVQFFTMTNMRS